LKLKIFIFVNIFLSQSLYGEVKSIKWDTSLITSFSYKTSSKNLELLPAYGLSFSFRDLFVKAETKFSLRTDFLEESWKSSEGSFSVGVERFSFREWGILTNPVSNGFLVGAGLAVGASQSVVNTNIQSESFKSYGVFEPLWGLMIDGQYDLTERESEKIFIDVMIRKIFAKSYVEGSRNELDFGIGIKF
jgi:hypothetical protein